MLALFVEIIGWVASVLIVGAYYLNIRGKVPAGSPLYIWCNLLGGLFFIINTIWHGAYPSAAVNVVWVLIAVAALLRKPEAKKVQDPAII